MNKNLINWEAFVDTFAGPILIISPDGKILYVNHATCEILAKNKDALINEYFSFPFELEQPCEIEILSKNNNLCYMQMYVKKSTWKSQDAFTVTLFDISDFKLAEKQLRISSQVFKFAKEGIIIADSSGLILDVNDEFSAITLYNRLEVIGKNPNLLASGKHDKRFFTQMWEKINKNGYWFGQIWNRKKDGVLYPQLLAISTVKNEVDDVTNYVAVFHDISQQVQQQEQLAKIAYYDVLTQLPNRNMLMNLLDDKMVEANKNRTFLAIIYIDMDDVKKLCREYGQLFCETLILTFSKMLTALLSSADILARCGDDEFVIVIAGMKDISFYESFISHLYKLLLKPLPIDGHSVILGISAGVAVYPENKEDMSHQLIGHANRAMFEAKIRGKNQYVLFDSNKEIILQNINTHSNDLMKAMMNDEFRLVFQPKISVTTKKVMGVEALIRWQHVEKGLLVPPQFLPEIMTDEFKIALDKWVIIAALKQISQWREIEINIVVSVNINALNFMNTEFMDWLKNVISTISAYDISHLEFEILESSLIYNLEKLSDILRECNELGIYFSLDDFGTVYSSLAYLKALPLRYMKIDQAFIKNLPNSQRDMDILRGILSLAKAINIKVIAEGVESIEHLKLLEQLGCDYVQGYYISEPLPPQKFEKWLAEWLHCNP